MVMGSSSPSHRLLVQCLKKKDQIAAMVGVKTNDIAPPKEADVGTVKGTRNNEMTKENSDIIIRVSVMLQNVKTQIQPIRKTNLFITQFYEEIITYKCLKNPFYFKKQPKISFSASCRLT